VAPGWHKGARNTGSLIEKDDVRGVRGVIGGSITGSYAINQAGRVLDSGTSLDSSTWTDPSTYYNLTNGQMTASILFKFKGSPANLARFFGKRASGAPGNAGFDFLISGGNYACEWSDGVGDQPLVSGTGVDTVSPRLVTLTHDRSTARIYLDGVLIASVAATRIPGNDATQPIEIFGAGTSAKSPGQCGMAGYWTRALHPREIQKLASDPYLMWRQPQLIVGGVVAGAVNRHGFFLSM
jgi:hypothetical protein